MPAAFPQAGDHNVPSPRADDQDGDASAGLIKRFEDALTQRELHLRAMYENAPVGLAEAGLDGRLVSVNPKYAAQLGYSPAEMVGRRFTDFSHPEEVEETLAEFHQLLAGTGGHLARERRCVHKDGTVVWLKVARSVIRDGNGMPRLALAVAEDITERKRAGVQQQLLYRLVTAVNRAASAEEVYEAAIDALCQSQECGRAAILLADAEGVMRFVAWRDVSAGYRATVAGHSPWRPADPNPEPVWIADVAQHDLAEPVRAAVAAEGIAALAFIPLTYGGRLMGKFMVYFDRPRAFSADRLQVAETIAHQLSFAVHRQRAAAELESLVHARTASLQEAIQQMEEFSYSVSHDLRAPVRAMTSYAQVVLDEYGPRLPAEVPELMARILKNGRRMDALIRDTLAYTRVSRAELTLSAVDLDQVVADAAQAAGCVEAVRTTPPLGRVLAHEPSLVQVISNLFTNAAKFVRPGVAPQISVTAEVVNGCRRLDVIDNGIGIPPELQSRLFKMFERLHPAIHYDGTGIGLAIVRRAIERMGGTVGIRSDGRNGSTFWIELAAA